MRDDLGMSVAGQFDGAAGALGDNRRDQNDDADLSFYEDAIERAREFLGSLPMNILLAASAAGLSIGVFLTNYQ